MSFASWFERIPMRRAGAFSFKRLRWSFLWNYAVMPGACPHMTCARRHDWHERRKDDA